MEIKNQGDALSRPALSASFIDWQSYFQMTKPTISMLVVATVVPALFMADKGVPKISVALASLLGTFMASGSAAVFNHLVDSDLDAYMKRTKNRPIPAGKVSNTSAAIFACVLGFASFFILYQWTNPLAAYLAVAANIFYVVGYTMFLKRRTVQNIVIGGAAGCVGPLIGWSAVTGTLAWPAWVLFAIIFLWTPPHFWSLAIKYKDDYARANIPMLPTVKGYEVTRRHIFLYTLTLIPAVLALTIYGAAGWIYGISALVMTLYFVWLAFNLYRSKENQRAMPLFYYSCFYLFGVFGVLTIDQLISLF